jgi:hypothetical protein
MSSHYIERLRQSSLVQILALILVILTYYYGLWNAYFASTDDFGWLGSMRHRSFGEAIQGLANGVRFLHYAMIWVKVRLYDLNSAPYYWNSLLQHAIVAIIVYGLVVFWTRQRSTAFLAALIFATKFSYFEVVTGITNSFYSFWAIIYLMCLGFFSLYLERRTLAWYLASVSVYIILTFAHDFALTIPFVLMAYHLTLGRAAWKLRSSNWSELRLHLPFWILWSLHMMINFIYLIQGTSEAIYSAQDYGPGLHQIVNLFYLVFLIIPNVHASQIQSFLTNYVTFGMVEAIWRFSVVLAIVGHLLAVICFWKGSSLVRFGLALIYLPFLPYTLWQGDFAGAFRYLYLPSIGFSILLALLFTKLHSYLQRRERLRYSIVVPAFVTLLLVSNLVMIQTWVRRHIANGQFRRAFVTQVAADFGDIESGSFIYIEVPLEKFVDLQEACRLIFRQPVTCNAFVSGQRSLDDITQGAHNTQVYWLQATPDGFNQVYPPPSVSP